MTAVRPLALLLLFAFPAVSAFGQPFDPGRRPGPPGFDRPRAAHVMGFEERRRLHEELNAVRQETYRHAPPGEQLREAVRRGEISPREAREQMREERMRRAAETNRFGPEDREKLRRDLIEVNREIEGRR